GLPRQRLNHHLHELEKAGLVELVEERRKGNCMERVLRSVARYYLISPEALGTVGADQPERLRDRFSWSYLTALAGKALRDLATLRRRADRAGKRLATFSLETEVRFASAKARHAFAEELTRETARLVAKYHDEEAPRGRRFRFFVGGYPQITSRKRATAASRTTKRSNDEAN
ncbi:MAG: ArsR family transcriptional regulator, partial [Acidobacteriota bacterium]